MCAAGLAVLNDTLHRHHPKECQAAAGRERFVGDKAPNLLAQPETPTLVRWCSPKSAPPPAILVVLRDPTRRVLSHYSYFHRFVGDMGVFDQHVAHQVSILRGTSQHGAVEPGAANAVPFVQLYEAAATANGWRPQVSRNFSYGIIRMETAEFFSSLYAPALRHWFETIAGGCDSFIISFFEAHIAGGAEETAAMLVRVSRFIGAPLLPLDRALQLARKTKDIMPTGHLTQNHSSAGMTNATRALLDDFFLPFNIQLDSLLATRCRCVSLAAGVEQSPVTEQAGGVLEWRTPPTMVKQWVRGCTA